MSSDLHELALVKRDIVYATHQAEHVGSPAELVTET